ncbi:hypothetical protein BLA34_15140 [Ralstonia solanacearum]|nr:hypothetical protein BLA34_15140 [Ralstonia solanacearum]
MSSSLIKTVEAERRHVVTDTFTPTWNELLSNYKSRQIKIDPDYQRGFRWTVEQQTEYIESLLLNIPTPPLFMSELPDGTFELIDGLQRFSTIIRFFSLDVFDTPAVVELASSQGNADNDNQLLLPTTLQAGPIVGGLEGLTAQTMPELLVRTIRFARIDAILLKRASSEVARFNVFMRLNRSGSVLSNQEIRNCSARLTDGSFADWLKEIASSKEAREAMRLPVTDEMKMGVAENVLRLLAFSFSEPASNRIDEFLDAFMYEAATGRIPVTDEIQKKVKQTFDLIHAAYPKGEAFRFLKGDRFSGAFSTNLFDIVACGVLRNISSLRRKGVEHVANLIWNMHTDADIEELVGAGSNTRKKMLGRIAFGHKWFRQ